MSFWRRKHRLRYRWLGLRPFGLFLEQSGVKLIDIEGGSYHRYFGKLL